MPGHVFISYSRQDSTYVRRLVEFLRSEEIPVWFDIDVEVGEEFNSTIKEKITSCSVFLPVMSPTAGVSRWVTRELTLAQSLGKPTLPLLLSGEPFFALIEVQYHDVKDGRLPAPDFVAALRRHVEISSAALESAAAGISTVDLTELRTSTELILAGGIPAGDTEFILEPVQLEVERSAVSLVYAATSAPARLITRVDVSVRVRDSDRLPASSSVRRLVEASQHPNMVQVLGGGVLRSGLPFAVHLFRSADVRPYLPPVSDERVAYIGGKMADALSFVHNTGLVLGSINPGDLLLASDEPLLYVPGIPGFSTPAGRGRSFVAPEVRAGGPPTQAGDVYSLASMLKYLLDAQAAELKAPEPARAVREILASAQSTDPRLRPSPMALRDMFSGVGRRPGAGYHTRVVRTEQVTTPGGLACEIKIKLGDIFKEDNDIVIGFSDTFDTDTTDGSVISKSSLQGQLVEREFGGDASALDQQLDIALRHVPVVSIEDRSAKPLGKLKRYAVGTVAALPRPRRNVYALAIGRMSNDLFVKSDGDSIRLSLDRLWEELATYYGSYYERAISMPILGAGLSRVDLDKSELLDQVLKSFKARSAEMPVRRELNIVIYPADHVDALGPHDG